MTPNYTITAIKLITDQNPTYQHIDQVFCHWKDVFSNDLKAWMYRQDVADQINYNRATARSLAENGDTSEVRVQHGTNGIKYLRTRPDHELDDNLLHLPRY